MTPRERANVPASVHQHLLNRARSEGRPLQELLQHFAMDFYDVWTLARKRGFAGDALARAIAATFERRRTPLPEAPPLALSAEFAEDRGKQAQWRAFASRARLDVGEHRLADVVALLRDFLLPPTAAARRKAFASFWPAGGPWQATPRRRR